MMIIFIYDYLLYYEIKYIESEYDITMPHDSNQLPFTAFTFLTSNASSSSMVAQIGVYIARNTTGLWCDNIK